MSSEENIIELKKYKRKNIIFMRRRINRGDGKKTVGWIMKSNNKTSENTDINALKKLAYGE